MIDYKIIDINTARASICVKPEGFDPFWVDLPIDENGNVPDGADLELYIRGFLPIGEIQREQQLNKGVKGMDAIQVTPLPPTGPVEMRRTPEDEIAIAVRDYGAIPMTLIADVLKTEVPGALMQPLIRNTDNAPVGVFVKAFSVPPNLAPAAALLNLTHFIEAAQGRGVPVVAFVESGNAVFLDYNERIIQNAVHTPALDDSYVITYPEYTVDFAKALKNSELNVARQEANESYFVFEDKRIECDKLSRSDIEAIASYIALNGELPPTFPMIWKTMDNEFIRMQDIGTFGAMYGAMVEQGTANFMRVQTLKQQLAAATTFEEVEAIRW